jgi:hypothetical protein
MYLRSSDGIWRIEPTRAGLQIRRHGFLVATCRTVAQAAAWLAAEGVDLADLIED